MLYPTQIPFFCLWFYAHFKLVREYVGLLQGFLFRLGGGVLAFMLPAFLGLLPINCLLIKVLTKERNIFSLVLDFQTWLALLNGKTNKFKPCTEISWCRTPAVRGHQVTWTSSQQKQHHFSMSSPTASRGASHNLLVSTPAPCRLERGWAHSDGAGSVPKRFLLCSWFGALFDLLQHN